MGWSERGGVSGVSGVSERGLGIAQKMPPGNES